ncbi:MAG: thioredoxin [Alphaproteobacteria bacterium]|nr:thioredoxin [Alphaproteobacteria bacterium]
MQAITDAQFKEKVLESKGISLVDFWAPWCGPCRQFIPVLEVLSEEMKDIQVYKMNVDENTEYAAKYGVRSIPTLLFFKDGELKETQIGGSDAEAVKAKIASLS